MEKLKLILTTISTALAYVFGGMDKMLAILVINDRAGLYD